MPRIGFCWLFCTTLALSLAAPGCGGRATNTSDAAVKDGAQKDGKPQKKDGTQPVPDGAPVLPDNGAPRCGTIAGLSCPGSMYCDLYGCFPDAPGVCVTVPKSCPRTYAPECGCDDKTYSNDCLRQQAKVALKHAGECKGNPPPPDGGGKRCGPFPGGQCGKSQVCDIHGCLPGASGQCVARPSKCPSSYKPVCGCDNRTYVNDCVRLMQTGAALKHQGPCGTTTPDAGTGLRCGPYPKNQCPTNHWCDIHGCGSTKLGTCVPKKPCTYVWAPVCGCDNKTYANDCTRLTQTGVPLRAMGQCTTHLDAGYPPPPDGAVGPKCSAANPKCSPGMACLIEGCGKNSPGTCVPHSSLCPPLWAPVCGCDKTTYANTCTLLNAKVAMLKRGAC